MRRISFFSLWFFIFVTAIALYASPDKWPQAPRHSEFLAVLLINVSLLKVILFKMSPAGLAGKRRRLEVMNAVICALEVVCWILAVFLCLDLAHGFFKHAAALLANPLPLNAMEGRETVKAWLLAHGQNIYPSMLTHPFLVTIYPPVYHVAVAAVASLAGWSIAAGRVVSLWSFLVMAILTGWVTLAWTRSRLAAFAVSSLLLFDPILADWSLHARPDMLAWCLALAGAGVFRAAVEGGGMRRYRLAAVSGILLCLALFTKQQTLPWLIGCLVWAAGKGRPGWRLGFTMCLWALALGAALVGSLELYSGGSFLRDVALYPKRMGTLPSVSSTENLLVRLGQVWDNYRSLWVLFLVCLPWAAWKKRWDLPLVLALVNAAFMARLLASWGADINYAFGTVVAALLMVGLLMGAVARAKPYGVGVVFALLFALLPATAERQDTLQADVPDLRALSGSILANTEGGHLFIGERPGRKVIFFDGIETQLYEQAGLWRSGESDLVRNIRQRSFDALVFYGDFMPQAVRDAANIFYERQNNQGQYTVLIPGKADLIAELRPSGTWHVSGKGRVSQADISTLNRETEGLAPIDRGKPGYLRFVLEAERAMSGVEVSFTLRLDPRDPTSAARYVLKDESGRPLSYSEAPRDGRCDVDVRAGMVGTSVELWVELQGNAWMEIKNGALAVIRGSF